MTFCFVASSRVRGQGAVEVIAPVLVAALDVGLAAVVARDDPPLGLQRLPDGLALLAAERVQELLLLHVAGQRAEPLAGGQVEEVAQQPVAR